MRYTVKDCENLFLDFQRGDLERIAGAALSALMLNAVHINKDISSLMNWLKNSDYYPVEHPSNPR